MYDEKLEKKTFQFVGCQKALNYVSTQIACTEIFI